jgi:hypothetical protein
MEPLEWQPDVRNWFVSRSDDGRFGILATTRRFEQLFGLSAYIHE